MHQARVTTVILDAIREYNQQAPAHLRISETPEAPLFGREGPLDSLALVSLILIVEEHVEKVFQLAVTLADERAMSQEKSPFRHVQSLATYVCLLLNDRDNG